MFFTDKNGRTEHRLYYDMEPPIEVDDGSGVKLVLENLEQVANFISGPMYPYEREVKTTYSGPAAKDHINPDHYKNYMVVDGPLGDVVLQWMEAQQYKPFWRANPKAFVHAILMQADKYLSRMGQKDDETQEMLKSLWYTKFAAAFMKNGLRPIRIDDIPHILGDTDNVSNNRYVDQAVEEATREIAAVYKNKKNLIQADLTKLVNYVRMLHESQGMDRGEVKHFNSSALTAADYERISFLLA